MAEKSLAGARAQSVVINGQKAFYRVRLLQAGDRYERGDTNVYVSIQDGAILETRSLFGDTAGDGFLGWQRPLHTGEVFGVTGKLIVLVLGLVPVFLGATGIYLWLWRKLRAAYANAPDSRARRCRRLGRRWRVAHILQADVVRAGWRWVRPERLTDCRSRPRPGQRQTPAGTEASRIVRNGSGSTATQAWSRSVPSSHGSVDSSTRQDLPDSSRRPNEISKSSRATRFGVVGCGHEL